MHDLILPDHDALLKMLRKHAKMKRVYRELTPVHGDGSGACEPSEEAAITRDRDKYAQPQDTLGDNTAQRFNAAGVYFLQVHDMLLTQWRDHAGASIYDCMHWRIPGVMRV